MSLPDSAIDRQLGHLSLLGLLLLAASFYLARDYGDSARIFYLLVLLPALLALPWWLPEQRRHLPGALLILLPPAWLALSTTWVDPAVDEGTRSTWYHIKPLLFLAGLWLASVTSVTRYPLLPRWLGAALCIAALPSAIISLLAYLPQALESGGWPRLEGISLRGDINVTATLYAVAAIFFAGFLRKQGVHWRGLGVVALLLFLAIALLSRSKVPLLALVVIFAALIHVSLRQLPPAARLALGLAPLLMLLIYALTLERIPLLERPEGYLLRLDLWSQTLTQARDAWWIGHGVGAELPLYLPQQPVIGHAHNMLLDTLRVGGLIGTVLLLLQLGVGALMAWQVARADRAWLPLTLWWLLGVFFLMTNGQQPLVKPHHIWFYYWIPLALIVARYSANRFSNHARADRAAR